MKQIHITETVLRDAQQSLIATRMPFYDFQGILDDMDKAGYHSIECWGGATFDSCLRYLNEDPWERLRNIKSHMKNTKLQMLLRGQNLLGYHHYSDDTVRRPSIQWSGSLPYPCHQEYPESRKTAYGSRSATAAHRAARSR